MVNGDPTKVAGSSLGLLCAEPAASKPVLTIDSSRLRETGVGSGCADC